MTVHHLKAIIFSNFEKTAIFFLKVECKSSVYTDTRGRSVLCVRVAVGYGGAQPFSTHPSEVESSILFPEKVYHIRMCLFARKIELGMTKMTASLKKCQYLSLSRSRIHFITKNCNPGKRSDYLW